MVTVFSLLTSEKGGRAMQVLKAIEIWLDYHKSNSRENIREAYPKDHLCPHYFLKL
jgi:hypothetical protein